MRLGSGRERSRCIMQFSLAAGSDRAVERKGARVGLGPRGKETLASSPQVSGLQDPKGEPRLPGVKEADPAGKGQGRVGY